MSGGTMQTNRRGPARKVATLRRTDEGHIRPNPSDEELLGVYTETGDREAFEELVRRYERPLYNYLHKYLGSVESAQDAFQTTFLQVHLRCRQFTTGRRFQPWLYKIATHQAIDLLRRNRRHQIASLNATACDLSNGTEGCARQDLLVTQDAAPGELLESVENSQRIRLAMEGLPTQFRTVLDLIMVQGLRYQEAADQLGIPLGSVKSRLHAALQNLRTAFCRTRAPA